MWDSLVSGTIGFLGHLAAFLGSWGLAIVALTLLMRVVMWPSSVTQQRSMRTMQMLQPKMKAIQERYKSDPQTMQRKMMEFYKEHKFNPFSGCVPMLIQLPVFILLYSVLMSPQFIEMGGNTRFLFIDRLDATIHGNAGISGDGIMGIKDDTKLSTGKELKAYLVDGTEIEKVKIQKPLNALSTHGEVTPGEPINLRISLNDLELRYTELEGLERVVVDIINPQTRETEKLEFTRDGNVLVATLPTNELVSATNYSVVFLVLFFIFTMWLTMKITMGLNKNAPQDPMQEAMQKSMGRIMPIMLGITFFLIPIPAGVLLYLVTSNIFQIGQTLLINKQLEKEDALKKGLAAVKEDVNVKGAKTIEAKEVKDVKDE
jgi:YidC/Oxa1 family membrane protein insertase